MIGPENSKHLNSEIKRLVLYFASFRRLAPVRIVPGSRAPNPMRNPISPGDPKLEFVKMLRRPAL
jgi:hypothetical protein